MWEIVHLVGFYYKNPFPKETDELNLLRKTFICPWIKLPINFFRFFEPEVSVPCSQNIAFGPILNWLHEVKHLLNPFLYFNTAFLSAPRFGKKSVHPQFSTRYMHVAKRSIQNSRARLKSQVDFVFFKSGRCWYAPFLVFQGNKVTVLLPVYVKVSGRFCLQIIAFIRPQR